jgi:hypothetical protein
LPLQGQLFLLVAAGKNKAKVSGCIDGCGYCAAFGKEDVALELSNNFNPVSP